MKKAKNGFLQAIIGIVCGIVFTYIISTLAAKGIVPHYGVTIYVVVNVIISLITINSMRYAGTLYTIGWLVGAFLFKDMLAPLDFALNIIAPVAVLIYRFTSKIKKGMPKFT